MRVLCILLILWGICLADVHIHNNSLYAQKPIASWSEIKDRNLTKQQYDYSCGSASLSTILTYYYNQNISEKDILDFLLLNKGIDINKKEEIETNEQLRESVSFSFSDLALFAQNKGFKAVGLALDLDALSTLKAPVIIYVNVRDMEHFSVYKGKDEQFVYLADPSLGNIKVSIAKFVEMFYQRTDLTHPGKILAILPTQENQSVNGVFMQHTQDSKLTYEGIKQRMMR